MDVALNQFNSECSSAEYESAIKLLFVYAKNIFENGTVEKYRRIRIGNEKFNSNVWRHETCRTIILIAGFEQVDDFIILPSHIDVSLFYHTLKEEMKKFDPTDQHTSTSKLSVENNKGKASLKLTSPQGIFVADLKPDLTLLSYMVEMGYSMHAAEKGLLATKNQGVQPAMDWIAEHPECHVVEAKPSVVVPTENSSATLSSSEQKYQISSRLRAANEQKHLYQEKLRLEAIKKAKLDKAEYQMAKKYLMKNLQSERTESKEKFEREKVMRKEASKNEQMTEMSQPSDVNMCTLRIKMPDGQTIQWETAKSTTIKSLHSHVVSLMGDVAEEFNVCIPHPHRLLDANDESSLQNNDLYPKATVVVQKIKSPVADIESSSVPDPESNPDDTQPAIEISGTVPDTGDNNHDEPMRDT